MLVIEAIQSGNYFKPIDSDTIYKCEKDILYYFSYMGNIWCTVDTLTPNFLFSLCKYVEDPHPVDFMTAWEAAKNGKIISPITTMLKMKILNGNLVTMSNDLVTISKENIDSLWRIQ